MAISTEKDGEWIAAVDRRQERSRLRSRESISPPVSPSHAPVSPSHAITARFRLFAYDTARMHIPSSIQDDTSGTGIGEKIPGSGCPAGVLNETSIWFSSFDPNAINGPPIPKSELV